MTLEEKLKIILAWDTSFDIEAPSHTTKVLARTWSGNPFESLVFDSREQAIDMTYEDVQRFIWKMCETIERERNYY